MFEVCSQHLIIFQSTPKILFIYLFSWRTIPYQSFHNNPISDLVNNQLQIYYIIFWGVHHQKVIIFNKDQRTLLLIIIPISFFPFSHLFLTCDIGVVGFAVNLVKFLHILITVSFDDT